MILNVCTEFNLSFLIFFFRTILRIFINMMHMHACLCVCVIRVLPAVVIRVPHELSQREQDFSDQGMGFPKPLLPDV